MEADNFYILVKIAVCLLLMIVLLTFLLRGGPERLANKIVGDTIQYNGEYIVVDKEHSNSLLSDNRYIVVLENEDGKRYPVYADMECYVSCNRGEKLRCSFQGYENISRYDKFKYGVIRNC